ncbi:MAG: hypothetical protein AAGE01_04555 [Pseudomonadota bacterium]
MQRLGIFIFGLVAYAVGIGGLNAFILFTGGWDFMPMHVDSKSPLILVEGWAIAINVGLVTLFGLQHSITARPGFKRFLTRILPASAERSSYVLLSGVIMLLIVVGWQPMDGTFWHAEHPLAVYSLLALHVLGWTIAFVATFLINHFELFGLQQVYHRLKNTVPPEPAFTERLLYRVVRHPLQMGVLIGLWATPTMSYSHALLALTMTVYVFIGLYFEERDLVRTLGQQYADYRTRVPMVLPLPKAKRQAESAPTVPTPVITTGDPEDAAGQPSA